MRDAFEKAFGSRELDPGSPTPWATIDDLPEGLQAQVTGGPAIITDLTKVFEGADTNLLLVTAGVVALLLLITYRSPLLWLVPLAVVGTADRVAAVFPHRMLNRVDPDSFLAAIDANDDVQEVYVGLSG